MNYILIITIVIIILLIYVLWKYFSNSGTRITANTNLNNIQTTPLKVNDTSVQFAYGVWIYINSWNPSGSQTNPLPSVSLASGQSRKNCNVIFTRSSKTTEWNDYQNYSTCLYLDPVSPNLYLDLYQSGPSTTPPILISSNFPIQKWCYVAFSVNNQYVDCYLDGKLVKSVYLKSQLNPIVTTGGVFLGSSSKTSDIYLNGLYHWANPLTPQDVWSNYLSGSGTNPFAAFTNTIGFGFAFYNNNAESVYRLF